MTKQRRLLLALAIPTLIAGALMYWYQWGAQVLQPAEVAEYIAKIEAQTQNPGARHDMEALRTLLNEDDGEPVYTVNLYKFHAVAQYPAGSGFGGTGKEAYDRFSKVMVSLMVARGSHPVYGSHWADQANSDWDQIVIVRYRSRRDLADLFASDQFAEASGHKWASLQEHERMVVKATHIPGGEIVFLLLATLTGIAIGLIGHVSMQSKST